MTESGKVVLSIGDPSGVKKAFAAAVLSIGDPYRGLVGGWDGGRYREVTRSGPGDWSGWSLAGRYR